MNKILNILLSICPDCNFSDSEDFIKDGLIDSFDIITLVFKLEEEFGFSIDGADVRSENFSNLKNLEKFIQRQLEHHES